MEGIRVRPTRRARTPRNHPQRGLGASVLGRQGISSDAAGYQLGNLSLPEYPAAFNSAWLNLAAMLFRRKFYLNCSHTGFVMYATDALQDETYVNDIRKVMKEGGRGVSAICLCTRRAERKTVCNHPGERGGRA